MDNQERTAGALAAEEEAKYKLEIAKEQLKGAQEATHAYVDEYGQTHYIINENQERTAGALAAEEEAKYKVEMAAEELKGAQEATHAYVDEYGQTHYITDDPKEKTEAYTEIPYIAGAPKADSTAEQQAQEIVDQMAQGIDVLGQGQQSEITNGKKMGFAKPLLLGIISALLIVAIILLAVLLK